MGRPEHTAVAANMDRKPFLESTQETQRFNKLENQADPKHNPFRPKYLQESDLVLNEGVHGLVHLDLLDQGGPVLADKDTLVQAVLIQHPWGEKKKDEPSNIPSSRARPRWEVSEKPPYLPSILRMYLERWRGRSRIKSRYLLNPEDRSWT